MSQKIEDLIEQINDPIIQRIINQFGNIAVDDEISRELSKAEIFRRLTSGHGKGKSHCSQNIIKKDGQLRNT